MRDDDLATARIKSLCNELSPAMSGIKTPKVFVSATSGDLRSVRAVVKEALLKIGCMPIEQADFPPDYRTVADFLTHQIEACDAIVHIAGKRYGAEPSPDSLPPGAKRRSYTQLEYDVAKRLKKKVFTFICGDDFPYDKCDAEPDDKVSLQQAHRAALFDSNDKYEPISTGDQCAERIKQLRLQLEELARELAAEQRRQRVAWTTVAAALVGLLAISIGIWFAVAGMRGDTTQIVDNTNALKNTTSNIEKTGQDIQKEVNESSQVQRETASNVVSIDKKVVSIDKSIHAVIGSDLLAEIAKKAEVDPLQIKQLVLQAQSAGIDVLAYTKSLSEEGRHEDAEGLARFVAETALRSENANFLAAAEAFLIAAKERQQIAPLSDDMSGNITKYGLVDQLAARGQGAWLSLSRDQQSENDSLFADLALTRGIGFALTMAHGEPRFALPNIVKAIAQLDEGIARNPSDKARLTKLRHRRAFLLAHKANWTSFHEANQLAGQALVEANRAVALTNDLDAVPARIMSLSTRVYVRLMTCDLIAETAARASLDAAQRDCREALSLPADESLTNTRCELAANLGQIMLELAERSLSDDERAQNLAGAIEQLTNALNESRTHNNTGTARIAALQLMRAYCMKNRDQHPGNEQEVITASETALPYGIHLDGDKLILAEFAITLADIKGPNSGELGDLKAVADLLNQTLVRSPVTVSPRMYAKTMLALARVYLAKSKIQRFSVEDGPPEQDYSQGMNILELALSTFSKQSAPRVWAEANWELGRGVSESNSFDQEISVGALKNALTILTREEDPQLWANANLRLGIELIKSRPAQLVGARESLRNAFLVHSQKTFPDRFRSDCHAIAGGYSTAALSATDDSAKQSLSLQALKFAVAASESERVNKTGNYYAVQLDGFAQELKANLSPDEQKQIDNEIERIKKEFAQNGIDPLK